MPPAHLKGPPVNYEHIPGCTGKIPYASQADAKRDAKKRNHSTYHCKHCQGWHVSSTGKISAKQYWDKRFPKD